MGKIFCLMGKSSSGKDTVFHRLKTDRELNLLPVITYTTRPKRSNETDGVEYYFITEAELNSFIQAGQVIEQREYHTVNGKWCYVTINNGQFDLAAKNYLAIVTPAAYRSLQNHFGNSRLYPIYIFVPDELRMERALAREKKQQLPNYEEMCRRFLADTADFASEGLVEIGITKQYENIDFEECIKNIKQDILYELSKP